MALLIYGISILILVLLFLLTVFNFARNRFKGDHTITFMIIIALLCLFDISFTLVLYLNNQPTEQVSSF